MSVKIITEGRWCGNCDTETDFDPDTTPDDWQTIKCHSCGAENVLHFDHISEAEAADQN